MPNTYVIYTGDGVQTDFPIPFSYLDESYVKVSVDVVDTAFTFLSPSVLQVIPAPAAGTEVRVYRETLRSELITTIPTSGLIRGGDINNQSQQVLDIAAESFDALDNATAASLSADDAAASADAADASATAAASSASASSSSATNADASATLASEWAEQPEDVEVTTGKYSALHWAAKAAQSAADAVSTVLGNLSTLIHSAVSKATPVGADELAITDSAASWAVKKITLDSIKTFITSTIITFASNVTVASSTYITGSSMELAQNRTVDGVSWIDFHSTVGSDYDARLIRGSGANANLDIQNLGTGNLNLISSGGVTITSVNGTFTLNGSPILVANKDGAISGGYWMTTYANDGTKSSGTYTPTAAAGNFKAVHNAGAFTLAADATTSVSYTLLIALSNDATAGAITFSGFNAVTGDALTTTSGDTFLLTIVKLSGFKTINVQAL